MTEQTLRFRYSLADGVEKEISPPSNQTSPFEDPEYWRREVCIAIEDAELIYLLFAGEPINPAVRLYGDEPKHNLSIQFFQEATGKWLPFYGGPYAYVLRDDAPKILKDK